MNITEKIQKFEQDREMHEKDAAVALQAEHQARDMAGNAHEAGDTQLYHLALQASAGQGRIAAKDFVATNAAEVEIQRLESDSTSETPSEVPNDRSIMIVAVVLCMVTLTLILTRVPGSKAKGSGLHGFSQSLQEPLQADQTINRGPRIEADVQGAALESGSTAEETSHQEIQTSNEVEVNSEGIPEVAVAEYHIKLCDRLQKLIDSDSEGEFPEFTQQERAWSEDDRTFDFDFRMQLPPSWAPTQPEHLGYPAPSIAPPKSEDPGFSPTIGAAVAHAVTRAEALSSPTGRILEYKIPPSPVPGWRGFAANTLGNEGSVAPSNDILRFASPGMLGPRQPSVMGNPPSQNVPRASQSVPKSPQRVASVAFGRWQPRGGSPPMRQQQVPLMSGDTTPRSLRLGSGSILQTRSPLVADHHLRAQLSSPAPRSTASQISPMVTQVWR